METEECGEGGQAGAGKRPDYFHKDFCFFMLILDCKSLSIQV